MCRKHLSTINQNWLFYELQKYKAFSWYSGLPGTINYAHLKHHPSKSQRVDVPGAGIFSHLRVSGRGTGRSVGAPDFQVRETTRT